eukprot:GHVR01055046.1.p1 GENE.GHVR01055046.1~~GHVR01055046.1.p1  ORF type:complete len:122 (+),score=30.79 GHVR01055046.1:46-411(+)
MTGTSDAKLRETEMKLAATTIVLKEHLTKCKVEAEESLEAAREALRLKYTADQIEEMEKKLIKAASDGLVYDVEVLLDKGLHVNCAHVEYIEREYEVEEIEYIDRVVEVPVALFTVCLLFV